MLKLQNLPRYNNARSIFCRQLSEASANPKKESHFEVENFKDLIMRRQSEAQRSVMLEVNTKDVCGQMYNYCKRFGDIKNAFVHTLKDERSMILLEYENVDSIEETLKYSGFHPNTVKWPHRFLSLHSSTLIHLPNEAPLQINNAIDSRPIANILRNAESFDDQVSLLYEHTRLTELSVRLRFLSTLQVQLMLNEFSEKIFGNAKVYPFGSSVNGFGKMGCDLDMALRFDQTTDNSDKNDNMPMTFQSKELEKMTKSKGDQVKYIASIIDYLLPGSRDVTTYHGSRVPIVRYFDANIHSSVDLSINNLDGFHTAEYMYKMGLLDPRIRLLNFIVRQWSEEFKLKGSEKITKFQLSYMCLSFLQQLNEPLVPTFEEVMRQIGNKESSNANNIVRSAFFFDSDTFQFETKNTSTVFELFIQFLEYYETFDFTKYMVTIKTVRKIPKPNRTPIILDNVFDAGNQWYTNAREKDCAIMAIMIRETMHKLKHCSTEPSVNQDWGLLEIITKLK